MTQLSESFPGLIAAVSALLGGPCEAIAHISEKGYTSAIRLRMRRHDGATFFVKATNSPETASWIQREEQVYAALSGFSFLPGFYGAGEYETQPFLVLEDLTDCHWPPPWTGVQVDTLFAALRELHGYRGSLHSVVGSLSSDELGAPDWRAVADDPEPFLALGYCSASWLNRNLPALVRASEAAPLTGEDFLHLDIRSDNICFRPDGRVVIVDWNWVCRGNRTLDIAGWLPSLHSEGGPPPDALLPNSGPFAACLAGFWAARAGLPPLPGAPHVREVQRRQLTAALAWAIRTLNLPPLDR